MVRDGDVPPSYAVLERIADREDVAPHELTPPLYETVDPDALDALADASDRDVRIQFTYRDYDVTVTPEGGVDVSKVRGRGGQP